MPHSRHVYMPSFLLDQKEMAEGKCDARSWVWFTVKSGSFVYDVYLSEKDWRPNGDELRVLSSEFVKLARQNLPMERLCVSSELATEMFEDNHFKKEQIPDIANSNPQGEVVLYRAGDHIDISRGPMVGHTGLVGRTTITSVHPLETEDGPLYRFQGVALPTGIRLNHFAYGILEERARKLNPARWPSQAVQFLANAI